jgi:hypothetical protein
VVALSLSLTQKKDGIPLHNVPRIHLHAEVYKHLLTCQAPTPRHCTAMPLQVGMEEGPRSKAVHVSGLQHCHYS